MRVAARTDANQHTIVAALRRCGCSVQDLSRVGRGVPDLLCGYHGQNYLIEIKIHKEKHTLIQKEWHASWRGQVVTLRSIEEAVQWINQRRPA